MMSFITGAAAAVVLSLGTWAALDAFTQTSIERIENPSVKLDGVDNEYSPQTLEALEGDLIEG